MSPQTSTDSVIAQAIALPEADRIAVMDAIHLSLVDPAFDHGSEDDPAEVEASWKEEIARRLAEVVSGKAELVPAEEAEALIRSETRPFV